MGTATQRSLLTVIALVYFAEYASGELSRAYQRGPLTLDGNSKLWFSVRIEIGEVDLALSVRQAPVTGAQWLGMGVAERGSAGMRGADLLSAHFNGTDCKIADRYGPFVPSPRRGLPGSVLAPIDTDGKNVWNVTKCERFTNGTLLLEVTRPLAVTSEFDREIFGGETRFLHAYGKGNFSYHGAAKASSGIVLLEKDNRTVPLQQPAPADADDVAGKVVFTSEKIVLEGPTYAHSSNFTCFTKKFNKPDASMIVAAEANVNSAAVTRVVLYGCEDVPYFENAQDVRLACERPSYSSGTYGNAKCNTVFYSWAPGVQRLTFPREAGLLLTSLNRRLLMELEIDLALGPYKAGDVQVTLNYTTKPRQHEAGTLAIGDPANEFHDLLVQNVTLSCGSQCTSEFKHSINVFAMHVYGGRFLRSTELRRGDQDDSFDFDVWDRINYYANNTQRYRYFDKPVIVNPGQYIALKCIFDSSRAAPLIVPFGRGKNRANCHAYAHFWPALSRRKDDGSLFYCARGFDQRGEQAMICGAGWRSRAQRSVADKAQPDCFSRDSTVQLENGAVIPMHQLVVGDRVLVAKDVYSAVFTFTHNTALSWNRFISIRTAEGSLALTPGHLIYANGKLVRAESVSVGDWVHNAYRRIVVAEVSMELRQGLYNPHTLHGDIIVDGIRVSTYTDQVEPCVAHTLLSPLRALHRLLAVNFPFALCTAQFRAVALQINSMIM